MWPEQGQDVGTHGILGPAPMSFPLTTEQQQESKQKA